MENDYNNIINRSPIFSLDKDENSAQYETEKNKLITAIYKYKIEENPQNSEYGLEMVETVRDCLKNYDLQQCPFLHYFNFAFSQRITIAKAKNTVQKNSTGIHFSSREIEQSRAIHAFLKKHKELSLDILWTSLEEYAEEAERKPEDFKKALYAYHSTYTQSGDAELLKNSDSTLFDVLIDPTDYTNRLIHQEDLIALIDLCECQYNASTNRSKLFLAIKLSTIFADIDFNGEMQPLLEHRSFFNREVFWNTIQRGKKIATKEISYMVGRPESSLSQSWTLFQKKLRERRIGNDD